MKPGGKLLTNFCQARGYFLTAGHPHV